MNLTAKSVIALPNGGSMPRIGFGLYQLQSAIDSIGVAVNAGYDHLDCARVYKNEIQTASFKNKNPSLFCTSKVTGKEHGSLKAEKAIQQSIETILPSKWDLFLLHDATSGPIRRLEAWKILEQKQEEGKLINIGVSNFSEIHLKEFVDAGVSKPSVNQIELHPFNQQKPIVEYCRKNEIIIQAYCPLVRGTRSDNPVILAISKETNKTPAQILIRWSLQHGFVPLPKSDTPSRIIENLNVFDFNLTSDQMSRLDSLDEGSQGACSWNPVAHA